MKVFLVEDSPEIRHRLHAMISELDDVELGGEADSQDGALDGIVQGRPDVVILDLYLASGSGVEVLRQVKTRQAATWIIVLTNHGYPQYQEKCMALGADYFLDKARDFERLGELLADLAGGMTSNKNAASI